MQADSFLEYALVFLLAAVIAVPIANRFRLGAVLGFLAAGLAIGPHGLGLVGDPAGTLRVAELGVVFLLFLLGLELTPQRLWAMRRIVFGAGGAQVAMTAAVGAAALWAVVPGWQTALVLGLALAQSSTAVAMQLLAERRELASAPGQQAFGISLFQDMTAIPILALLPVLALSAGVAGSDDATPDGTSLVRALAVIGGLVLVGRAALPPLFRAISRAGSVEVFSAAALLVVIGTTWLMQLAGLSVTLGAFIAGVLLANSEFRHEIESHIQPFKGLLLGLFFMSVGMAIDLSLIERHPLLVLGGVLAVLAIKMPILYAVGRTVGRLGHGEALMLAGLIGAGGEFAFVILAEGHRVGLLDAGTFGLALAIAGLALAMVPLTVPAMAKLAARTRAAEARAFDELPDASPRVILAGFGRVGQIVSRVLSAQGVAHTVLEPSTEQLDFSRRFGNRLYYGDPTRPELLRAARADRAEVFVVATDDPEQNVRTARIVKRLFPHLVVLARARNRQHAFRLMDLGVDWLVRETFHSSLELARETLVRIGVPDDVAIAKVERFRRHDEALLARQYLIHDDEAALVQSAQQARAELESLFEADRRTD
jgi:glutathione-regulated potassium-efflux system protein KefB